MSTEGSEPQQKKRGRPTGSGVVARMRYALATDEQFEQLVRKTFELAMTGDPAALRILWDRVAPAPRGTYLPVSVTLPSGDLATQAQAILNAAAQGRLPLTSPAFLSQSSPRSPPFDRPS